jgi:NhaP-type Na+/H+ or K+/H+ antiporter
VAQGWLLNNIDLQCICGGKQGSDVLSDFRRARGGSRISMFNAIQVFGLVLLGGLAAGELSRRVFDLPRTTGYVLLGLAIGESGFRLVTPEHIASAELFIDLALGLILFELGYLVPRVGRQTAWRRLVVGIAIAAVAGAAIMLVVGLWGFSHNAAFFAGALLSGDFSSHHHCYQQ